MTEAKISTIEVAQKPEIASDTVSALEQSLRDIGIKDARAFSTSIFTLAGELDPEKLGDIGGLVHHSVTQDVFTNTALETEKDWDFTIRVDFKPGVTDNAARVLARDLKLVDVEGCIPFTSKVHYIKGELGEITETLRDMLERVASNPQIHDITLLTREEYEKQGGFEKKIHPVALGDRPNFFWVDIGAMDNDELALTGKKGTLNTDTKINPDGERGGTLALGMDYMLALQKYALSGLNTQVEGREKGFLTDTEIELIAQMWSEHCRHSLYNAAIPESEDGIFTHYIKNPTLEALKKKPHLGVSIYKDNAGVFRFNDKWLLFVKNETHNSPSALDPFGGAITGIVGVNRDPAGTGLGGEVIGNFLFYFLGHPGDKRRYFKKRLVKAWNEKKKRWDWVAEQTEVAPGEIAGEWKLDELLLNPKQIFDGVVKGVEEGGNQMGIPINIGMCTHHDRYNGKPIVGVGSIGRAPIEINGILTHKKHIDVGDRLYIAGGRAGRDGIHGATFSSEGLSENSPATAVQIGDPYTQRKLFEALLEARDRGYIKFITDLGAGGVSCAALEMAQHTNGLEIDIDRLLIKYKGMTATELFMNESQERMAFAIDPKHRAEVEAIFRKHEVEFSDIGKFTDSGRAIVHANGEKVVDMDMNFIHHGFPSRSLSPANYKVTGIEHVKLVSKLNAMISEKMERKGTEEFIIDEFMEMHNRPNLASIAPFMDKMDSTVKGLQVQHCIQGKGRVSTKASCTLVDLESPEGLIQSYGHSERQSYVDSERMGKNAFLRSIGNNIAMGGRLDYMVATDQALWQSSDKPEYQQMLIEANRGMAKVIEGCEIPVISGKDSMYNQATVYDKDGNVVKRGVFPTLLMTTFSKIDSIDEMVTVDAKQDGDLVYVVGAKTKADLGGSEYVNKYSEESGTEFNAGQVSDEDVSGVFDTFRRVDKAARQKLMQSAKYVENGGLAIALRDTAMAGGKGIVFDMDALDKAGNIELHEAMYGETEGRFVITIKPGDREKFEELFRGKCSRIGVVGGSNIVMKAQGKAVNLANLDSLYQTYHRRAA